MKFLHTADLHLDSAFCLSSESESAARRERQRELLKKIFDCAIREKCDMVLISGDLFDRTYITPETRELCVSLFEKFQKPIIISPGNHDPYTDSSFYKSGELPENVWVFTSSELQFFDFPELDTTVAGFAFTSAALTSDPLSDALPVRKSGRVMLLCAHGDVDMPLSRYAPMQLSRLMRLGFDYVALGHVHKYTELAENIRYCGFAEGRSFDELGNGGVLICETDGMGKVHVKREILSEKMYLCEEIAVNPDMTEEGLLSLITQTINRLCESGEVYLRLSLVGTTGFDSAEVLSQIKKEDFLCLGSLQIDNCTLCVGDISALEADSTLRGEFYRSLLPELCSEDAHISERARRALYIGLAAIDGKDFTSVR